MKRAGARAMLNPKGLWAKEGARGGGVSSSVAARSKGEAGQGFLQLLRPHPVDVHVVSLRTFVFVTELKFQGKSGFRLFPSRKAHAQNTRSSCQHPRQALSPLPPCTTGLHSPGWPRPGGTGGRWECFPWSREASAPLQCSEAEGWWRCV